ncbi:MAG: OsmC family protein [candidate division KSB1 bacterium]|nr:OsmC family protein [candidate division KSB1 bacterium]
MKVYLKQIEGLALAARADSGHWVTMDSSEEFGGQNAGSRPVELLLMALAGCTAMDVISILKKKRSPVTRFEMEVEGERTEEHPKVFTRIRLKYIVYGRGVKEADVQRAIELSIEKYCSVHAMLSRATEISTEFEIREPAAA